MAIMINAGPMKRVGHIEHPRCMVDGIHALSPALTEIKWVMKRTELFRAFT
jgi:hypothetical protein